MLSPVLPKPLNNCAALGGPDALALHHDAQGSIQKADAERFPDEPGVQVQDQEPAVVRPIVVEGIKTLSHKSCS